jgi:hypothetical protein
MNVNQDLVCARTGLFCLADGHCLYPVECAAKHPAHLRLRDYWYQLNRLDARYLGRESVLAR